MRVGAYFEAISHTHIHAQLLWLRTKRRVLGVKETEQETRLSLVTPRVHVVGYVGSKRFEDATTSRLPAAALGGILRFSLDIMSEFKENQIT